MGNGGFYGCCAKKFCFDGYKVGFSSLGTLGHGAVSLPANCAFKISKGLASDICKIATRSNDTGVGRFWLEFCNCLLTGIVTCFSQKRRNSTIQPIITKHPNQRDYFRHQSVASKSSKGLPAKN